MKKTILILLLLILLVIFIAFAVSTIFFPEKKMRYNDCVLMQNKKTLAVDCFGCANNVCKDASLDWEIYAAPEIGIPYACEQTQAGCKLVQ
ncbi:MAG: hypothetical protein NTZ49_01165 [Candidatus Parcubacteria bacterium]|nr:hypothetical protein [Candidatus Parcubacteria bacterium]